MGAFCFDRIGAVIDMIGKAVIIRTETKTFDPATGETTKTGTVDTATKAIVDFFDNIEVGSLVERNDRKVTVAAAGLGIVPDADDHLIIDTVRYQVINVESQYVGPDVAAYVIQARK